MSFTPPPPPKTEWYRPYTACTIFSFSHVKVSQFYKAQQKEIDKCALEESKGLLSSALLKIYERVLVEFSV